jgi:hypothetical protein
VKTTSHPTPLTFNWTWCDDVSVAMAPGVSTFAGNDWYGHGGLTLQESLIPVLEIRADGGGNAGVASIKSWKWKRLSLHMEAGVPGVRTYADLRKKAAKADTSIVEAAELVDGRASLVVVDDGLEGESAFLIIVDKSGQVLVQQVVPIGD